MSFNKKAHTIPSSLGGQNYNVCVCDDCNTFFGIDTKEKGYSIETVLKETFCVSRQRFLNHTETKRKVGRFKSKFFEIKERNGKYRLEIKQSFRFTPNFQKELCRKFKQGLIKMWFEEFDRQNNRIDAFDPKFDLIRNFSRYNIGDLPVFYFKRSFGAILMLNREAETPTLIFDKMIYLFKSEKFTEIEFLGHLLGFAISDFSNDDFNNYLRTSFRIKSYLFKEMVIIDRLTDIDFTLNILDK